MKTKTICHGFLSVAAVGWLFSGQLATAQSYTWTTIAGLGGLHGSTDGVGNAARLNTPFGIANDGAGNLLVSDTGNNLIRALTPNGTNWAVTTVLGGSSTHSGAYDGSGANASFYEPLGIAPSGTGQFFEVENNSFGYDSYLRKIALVDGVWSVTTVHVGTGLLGYLSSGDVSGAATDPSGDVFVAYNGDEQVLLTEAQGVNWSVATIAGSNQQGTNDGVGAAAGFNLPQGICVDASENVYVADTGNNTIRKIALDPYTAQWTTTTIGGQAGAAGFIDGTNGTALFDGPDGMAIDAAGNLYVSDANNNAIRKMTPNGTNWIVTTIGGQLNRAHGTADGVGTAAGFYHPATLTVDSAGRIFVADYANNTIRLGVPLTANAPPLLQMATAGKTAYVIWPASVTGMALQETTNIASGNWQTITAGITTNLVFTGPMTNGQTFYRLQQ